MEGSAYGLIKVLSQDLLGGAEKNHKTSVEIAGLRVDI
jgi:hypothetical protein